VWDEDRPNYQARGNTALGISSQSSRSKVSAEGGKWIWPAIYGEENIADDDSTCEKISLWSLLLWCRYIAFRFVRKAIDFLLKFGPLVQKFGLVDFELLNLLRSRVLLYDLLYLHHVSHCTVSMI
jgi:hypothetical protein